MSKGEKLMKRLLAYPKDFTYGELKTLLLSLGYNEVQGTGSRVCFSKDNHKIKLHKPHPGNLLKSYQVELIVDALSANGSLGSNRKTT